MRQYAAALGFVAMAGCSFVFVSGTPANHRERPDFDCTSGRALPIVDTAITALQTLNLLSTLAINDADWNKLFDPNVDGGASDEPPISRSTVAAMYGVTAAVFAASAVYGFVRTGTCRRAKEDRDLLMKQGGGVPGNGVQPGGAPQPGTWPPPPQPGVVPQPGTWPPPKPAPAPAPDPSAPPPDPSGPPPTTP